MIEDPFVWLMVGVILGVAIGFGLGMVTGLLLNKFMEDINLKGGKGQ